MNELDPQSIVPLYKQLKDLLLQEIKEGIYKANQKIPTELELSEKYQISRMTVRKALAELVEEGVLAKKQGKGTIVNVSSVAASKGHINRPAYSASKGAVTAMTRSMALELCHDNIRVNCVSPGTTLTPSLESRIAHSPDPEEAQKQFCARQPINTLGTPKEIAEAILFAADDAASYMIGANIAIDGGVTM